MAIEFFFFQKLTLNHLVVPLMHYLPEEFQKVLSVVPENKIDLNLGKKHHFETMTIFSFIFKKLAWDFFLSIMNGNSMQSWNWIIKCLLRAFSPTIHPKPFGVTLVHYLLEKIQKVQSVVPENNIFGTVTILSFVFKNLAWDFFLFIMNCNCMQNLKLNKWILRKLS